MSRAPPKDPDLREAYEQARALAENLTDARRSHALRLARGGAFTRKASAAKARCDDATLARWLTEAAQCFDTKSEERCGECPGCLAKKEKAT